MKSYNLRFKINTAILAICTIIAILFGAIYYPLDVSRRKSHLEQIEILMKSIFQQKKEDLANEIFADQMTALSNSLKEIQAVEGISSIIVYKLNGSQLISTGITDPADLSIPAREGLNQSASFGKVVVNDQLMAEYAAAIKVIGEHLGYIKIFFDLTQLEQESFLNKVVFISLLLSTLLVIIVLLNLFLFRNVIRPTTQLREAMGKVQKGHLGEQIQLPAKDEIGEMGAAFNEMSLILNEQQIALVKAIRAKDTSALRLEKTNSALEDINDRLEDIIKERTAELRESYEKLEKEIAERLRMDEEKKHLEKRLLQSQKMEAIGTLAGGIAHDFNNILSAIIGYTEIVLQYIPQSSHSHSNLKKVLKASDRAKDLVKQILTFSRQSEIQPKPIQVKPIVKEALKLLRASLPATIEIKQNLQSFSEVMADPTQIHQVLMNLCTNASHAMRKKGGRLMVSLKEETLDTDFAIGHPDITPGRFLKLTVTDSGHGISSKNIDRIFDPFFTTKTKGEGTGMGLAVVHGIITGHGGALTVKSEIDKGSTFDIYLPIIESDDAVAIDTEKPLSLGNERILFVDDEDFQIDLGRQMLERLGYHVVTRTDGREALELFRERPDDFDLIITDMTMPNMTGDELGKNIISLRPDFPIIICTGYSQHISEEKAKALGIKGFIMKPIIMKDLAHIVRNVLDLNKNKKLD